ncbi:MAG: hypothetical protein MHPDNHAH_03394 [Anaerolineales bacterium]|nr:hypothetical protein [Anaerolineales bacterium]
MNNNIDDAKAIWFIDNDEKQLRLYKRHLERGIELFGQDGENFVVKGILAKPHKDDYLFIFDDPNTAAILVDQKLQDKGGVDHSGIELAKYLRELNDIIPIYMLTNFSSQEEYEENEWSVDAILDKGDIIDQETKLKTVISRIFRRIAIFHKVFGEREVRFRELLKKSLSGRLTKKEKDELEELEFSRAIYSTVREDIAAAQPNKLDEALKKIDDLKKMMEKYNK